MTEGTSPLSSGPAGPLFEGQVGASYLLALLLGAEPRGLPGTVIDRVAFQRAGEGHPLDDVIVYAHDHLGVQAVLEIQVKRGMTFAPNDPVFHAVIEQIGEVSRKPEFDQSRHELGIAISRTSLKIGGAYQDVLTWARQVGDAKTFINRVKRSGAGSADKRAFVETFKTQLAKSGARTDDEAVWKILQRIQIFHFDFTAQGSGSEELARERAAHALHPEDSTRAADLWSALTNLALQTAAAGGDRTRDELRADLQNLSFRLAGDRNYTSVRAALKEAAQHTLAEIDDHVAGVRLARDERVTAVRAALDQGRYVEIRGDGGVGKSAVLKYLAEQAAAEASVMVLSPSRTVPRGWMAMRAIIGFEGSARDLFSDMASAGSGILFVDSLDFYGEEERRTVIDLVREAAAVPGFSVVVTARTGFGEAEPNWLPSEALDRLGRAEPVVIAELSDSEITELREAAPQLNALLEENHPARSVARNLFRLGRLTRRLSSEDMPRTEVEMAEQWWRTADGVLDPGHRERARALVALASQAVQRIEPLDAREIPAAAVNALVDSETLRDLGNDKVTFRHDVLRDWAIANVLFIDGAPVHGLPLDRPVPTSLMRGIELAARMMLERNTDASGWHSFLLALSKDGAHGSWRRMALLALVRSEIAERILEKAKSQIVMDRAQLLRELIRVVMAVEVDSAAKRFASAGIDPRLLPVGMNLPKGPAWHRLILWLLRLGVGLPPCALPEVVELYTAWSMALLGQDALTPTLLRWLYYWLSEIQGSEQKRPFNGDLSYEEVGTLARDLTTGFLLFCDKVPDLAVHYIGRLKDRADKHRSARQLPKFRGALARAAPKEFAELTADLLLSEADEDRDGPFREPFGHQHLDFVPASPAQGPFLDLLSAGPEHGLKLIRQLVDHEISWKSRGRAFGDDAITIVSPDGSDQIFPWIRSYNWSRDPGTASAIVASALMALEAWAHNRIDAGEPFDKVMADVIGTNLAPAAYLLVAVDLLLSHWPQSRTSAIPYLACPVLLCLDRQRVMYDNTEVPDILGLRGLTKEPIGIATLDSLKARPSRRYSLEQFLSTFALDDSPEGRDVLAKLLRRAEARLGQPNSQSDLGDPEFMVVHALNLVDPKNWQKKPVQTQTGTREVLEYIPPPVEAAHLQPLQDQLRDKHANAAMQAKITVALGDPARSSVAFAASATRWAQDIVTHRDQLDDHQSRMRDEAIITAAVIAVRDGGADLIAANENWIRETFVRALKGPHDPAQRMRTGLHFNPFAIAFVGVILLLKNRFDTEDMRILLEAAADEDPAAAHGFAVAAIVLAEIDEKLARAVLRSALSARNYPRRYWDTSEEEYAARQAACRAGVERAIETELAWLAGDTPEPQWPEFPLEPARARYRSRVGREWLEPEETEAAQVHTDHHSAALWLSSAAPIFDVAKRPCLRDIVQTYARWTYVANGSQLEAHEDVDDPPHEWNGAYFKLVAACLIGLTSQEMTEMAVAPISSLPDESFCDILTIFARNVDDVYFNNRGLHCSLAVEIRAQLAQRMMASDVWLRHVRDRSERIETHLGPAVAVLFFNEYSTFQPAKCYVLPKGIEGLDPFLPTVKVLAESGTFLFVALVLLNLLEVSPRTTHLPVIVAAARSWLIAQPDDHSFWIDSDIGRRVCLVIDAIIGLETMAFAADHPLRGDIDGLLAGLVRLGVADAHRLEEAIRSR